MIFYNGNTVFGVAAAVCGGFSAYSLFQNGTAALFGAALGALALDLTMRLRDRSNDVPLLAPDAGGHIGFVPVWIWATFGTLVGLAEWLDWL
ncbi:MAG: hypothetical protein WD069_09010 [Planctomycetales bacterium]